MLVFVCMHVYRPCVCSTDGGQEKARDSPLKLELQTVANHPVGMGIDPKSPARAATALPH